jgi:fluoride exporter
VRIGEIRVTPLGQVAMVAAGSAVGGVARWLAGRAAAHLFGTHWPFGTFLINVTGCLFLGWFAGATGLGRFAEHHRLLLAVGFAGGYTTFSTFGIEADLLLRDRRWVAAALYVFLSVFLGLLAFRLGERLAG